VRAFSGFFFPRALGGAGINSSEMGTGRSGDDSTFGESGLPLPPDFLCFVDTSDKSCGLAVCTNVQQWFVRYRQTKQIQLHNIYKCNRKTAGCKVTTHVRLT